MRASLPAPQTQGRRVGLSLGRGRYVDNPMKRAQANGRRERGLSPTVGVCDARDGRDRSTTRDQRPHGPHGVDWSRSLQPLSSLMDRRLELPFLHTRNIGRMNVETRTSLEDVYRAEAPRLWRALVLHTGDGEAA